MRSRSKYALKDYNCSKAKIELKHEKQPLKGYNLNLNFGFSYCGLLLDNIRKVTHYIILESAVASWIQ